MRLARLPVVDAEVMRERLIDHTFCCIDHRYWYLHLLGQCHEVGGDAEPVSICILKTARCSRGVRLPQTMDTMFLFLVDNSCTGLRPRGSRSRWPRFRFEPMATPIRGGDRTTALLEKCFETDPG
jgi:hypothetical protein